MAFSVPGVFVQEKNKLHTVSTWHELWEVRIETAVGTVANIVGHTSAVVFDGVTYQPFPISRAEFTVSNDGTLVDTTVTISNVDRAVQSLLETSDNYFRGQTVIYRLVNSATLATTTAVITERFRVGMVELSPITATFHLGHVNLYDQTFPGNRFIRGRCRWVYGSADCGYDKTQSGAISASCDKTLNGAAGCTAHGANEVTNGKPRLHPLRFGGFPSIPRGPYV